MIWNSSGRIISPPLAFFIVMLPKAHLTFHSRMLGSRWVIIPLWLSGSVSSFWYSSSVYSCHLLISSASVWSIPFVSFIVPIFAWNVPLVSAIFLKRSLVLKWYKWIYLQNRNSNDLTEAEDIKKRWQEYKELCKKVLSDPYNQDFVITHLEPDILECEVRWVLGSITTKKASGGDGIPAELFQMLKYDAIKMLHSIYQEIWKTQQ